jgi:hypothetical protein
MRRPRLRVPQARTARILGGWVATFSALEWVASGECTAVAGAARVREAQEQGYRYPISEARLTEGKHPLDSGANFLSAVNFLKVSG